MIYVKPFNDLNKHDAGIAGGKGASLGEMTNAGIPVPSGFVVLSSAFEYFIKETDLIQEIDAQLQAVNHKEMESVERASEVIRELIENAPMPKDLEKEITSSFKELDAEFVAVRSSATAEDGAEHAWAGQLDSFLNTTKKDLIRNVLRCFASLFTPRAIFYRFEKGLHNSHISVAVVIQKMVQSEKSGIAFSVHPVTEDRNQMIIEGSWGLGEAIVSGQVTPDSFVVLKDNKEILDINIAEKSRGLFKSKSGTNEWEDIGDKKANEQCLNGKEILELAELIMKIENHYGFPCDIEWAFEKNLPAIGQASRRQQAGKFYIVQSRPITTLANIKKNTSDSSPAFIHGQEWFLAVTRNMSFWHQCLAILGWYNNTNDFGVKYNLRHLSLTTDGTHTHCFFFNPNFSEYLEALKLPFSNEKNAKALMQRYIKFGNSLLDSLVELKKKLNEKNLTDFLVNYKRYTAGLMITTAYSKSGTDLLSNLLAKKLGYDQAEIPNIIATITYPKQHTPLFESQQKLLEIGVMIQESKANKKLIAKAIKDWVENFGNIPVNYCEEPWTITHAENQLKSLLKNNCKDELVKSELNHKKKIKEVKILLKQIDNQEVENIASGLAYGTFINEYRKNIFSKVSLGFRPIFQKIAKRAGSNNWRDCFFLTPEEMLGITRGEKFVLSKIKKSRKCVSVTVSTDGKLEILSSDVSNGLSNYIDELYGKKKNEAGENIGDVVGFSANKGVVQGVVRVVLSSKDFKKVKRGDVLVATMTSVDFVPVMEKASAFVTNEGGVMCHASIVAREMNKPCIIGTKIATKVLKDGDLVEVDAERGIVTIIKKYEK